MSLLRNAPCGRAITVLIAASLLAGLAFAADRAPRQNAGPRGGWQPLGLSGGGAMFAPAISPADPNLMMINCDMSCAFVSRDGGRAWQMIHHAQLRANTRCRPGFHPTDPRVIFAADGGSGRLKVSRDQGRTFTPIGNLEGSLEGQIALDPDQPARMLAAAGGRVWRSDDEGNTWTRVEGPKGTVLGFHFDRTSPAKKRVCFAATPSGIWRSDDGGRAWADASEGLPWREVLAFSAASNREKNSAILYCAIESRDRQGFRGGVYRSADRGRTWASAMGDGINKDTQPTGEYADGPLAQYRHLLAADAEPRTVWAFNTSTGFPPPHHATAYRSDDAGLHWRATFYPDPRFPGYNVAYDYTTATLNQSFPSVPLGVAIAGTDPNVVLTVDMGNSYLTHDGGKTWTTGHSRPAQTEGKPTDFINTGLVVTSTWHYDIDPFQPQRHYLCYTDIGFARSLDAGRSWRWWRATVPPAWRNTTYQLAFDPDVPGKIWGAFSQVHDIPNGNVITGSHYARIAGGGKGGIALSEDFAATWKPTTQGLPDAPACSVILDPKSPRGKRTLYAAIYARGVFKSLDDGRSWTDASRGLGSERNRRVCRVELHPDGTLFALITALCENRQFSPDGVGLYRSADGGQSWRRISQSPVFLWPKDFALDPADSGTIYLGAADARDAQQGGLWRTSDGGVSWTRIARQGSQHFGAALHPKHKDWIYMTLCEGAPGAGLWLSKDRGATWKPFDALPFSNIQRVSFDPADPATIYVTTFGGSAWKGPAEP